jgi:hypothetical protein
MGKLGGFIGGALEHNGKHIKRTIKISPSNVGKPWAQTT